MPSIFLIVIPIICALLFLLNFAVYKGLISIFEISSHSTLLELKILLIVFGMGFVVATILAFRYNNIFTRLFYTVSASWYGFLFYLLLAIAIYAIVSALFGSMIPHMILIWLGKGLIFCALIITTYGLWNAEQISLTEYDVSINGLPSAWHGKRAVWVSDIHLDQVHNEEYSRRIVSAVEKQKPDIVFIGGDLYDGVKIDERAAIAPFKELKPKDGIYFITGNHEEFSDKTHYVDAVKEAGIRVLNNEMINVDGVNIIGVDDRDSTQKNVFENILAGLKIDKNVPTILLKHQPFDLDIAEKFGISMQISGHTHQAQIYPLSYITKLVYKGYDYGYKQYDSMQVFTSSGVGTWGPPLRVGTKSEILIFNFQ
jgi:predicted MPP superfamily phosphohydrolase